MMIPHQWHGAGPPLLLLPGLGARGTSFQPFLALAAERYRVLTIDQRGAGQGPPLQPGASLVDLARDVLERLDAEGIERIDVVARSMGGMIGQELALLAPERIGHLVLASTTGRVDTHLAQVFRLLAQMAETGVPAEIRHRTSLLWSLGPTALESDRKVQAYLDVRIRNDRPEDYALQARACSEHDSLDRLGRLTVPTLILAGDEDRLMPPAHAMKLVRAIPGAELCWIPSAGHLAYLEAPGVFASAVFEFLARSRREAPWDANCGSAATVLVRAPGARSAGSMRSTRPTRPREEGAPGHVSTL